MITRHAGRRVTCAATVLASALLALPAAAVASSGSNGSGGGGLGGGAPSGVGAPAPTASPSAAVSATGDGVTLDTTSTTMVRGRLVLTGTATGAAGQTLEIERRGLGVDATWQPTLQTTVSTNGSFRAVWRASRAGRYDVRALIDSGDVAAAGADPTLTVTVYPTSKATIYGPGFYGQRTACGARLRRTTLGVANRTLPCGTKVSILYAGRTLTVPVIDRGPYANGASWDLTTATARALGMSGTSWIGTVAQQPTTASDLRAARRHRA